MIRQRLPLLPLLAGVWSLGWQTPASQPGPTPRAMWLWDPAPQLSDAAVRARFFDFLTRERVATVWAQVGTEQAASPAPPARSAGIGPARRLTHEAGWREFIGEAPAQHPRRSAHCDYLGIEGVCQAAEWCAGLQSPSPRRAVTASTSISSRTADTVAVQVGAHRCACWTC